MSLKRPALGEYEILAIFKHTCKRFYMEYIITCEKRPRTEERLGMGDAG